MDFGNWLKDVGREIKRVFKGKSSKNKDVQQKNVFGVSLQEAATRNPSCEVCRKLFLCSCKHGKLAAPRPNALEDAWRIDVNMLVVAAVTSSGWGWGWVQVPWIMSSLVEHLTSVGLESEGIFREAPSAAQVVALPVDVVEYCRSCRELADTCTQRQRPPFPQGC